MADFLLYIEDSDWRSSSEEIVLLFDKKICSTPVWRITFGCSTNSKTRPWIRVSGQDDWSRIEQRVMSWPRWILQGTDVL